MSSSEPLFHALDRMQTQQHAPMKDIFAGPPITAREVKQEAIVQVERNANKEWLAAFRRSLENVARRKLRFTADDIWDDFDKLYPQPDQHEPRAAGAVVVKAIKDGVIVTVKGVFWNSRRKSCHHRPIQCYMSLIFK